MLFPGLIWNTLIFYLTVSVIGSLIPVNTQFEQATSGTEIYVASNGVHTDLVVPIENEIYNWKSFFNENEFKQYWSFATHLGFGCFLCCGALFLFTGHVIAPHS